MVIGHSRAILRMDGGDTSLRAVTLGYELGVFSRFYMQNSQKDLINIDYRLGLPVVIRNDNWWIRITLRHLSSHAGDDYLTRFSETVLQEKTSCRNAPGTASRAYWPGGSAWADASMPVAT